MTTLNTSATATKITRAEAIRYAIQHLENAPQDIMEVLTKIEASFTRKPATATESKAAKENKELAVKMAEYVKTHFNPEDLEATNARSIVNEVPGITTTQKVVAVARYANDIKAIKIKGRTFYVPSSVKVD